MHCLETSFLYRKTAWLDMLVLVDFDSLTDRARLDILSNVSPKAWPDVSEGRALLWLGFSAWPL